MCFVPRFPRWSLGLEGAVSLTKTFKIDRADLLPITRRHFLQGAVQTGLCLLWLNFRGLWLRAHDSEFAHAVIERGAIQTETRCRAGWTTNHPFCVVQNFEDVIAFDRLERDTAIRLNYGPRRLFQLRQRYFER